MIIAHELEVGNVFSLNEKSTELGVVTNIWFLNNTYTINYKKYVESSPTDSLIVKIANILTEGKIQSLKDNCGKIENIYPVELSEQWLKKLGLKEYVSPKWTYKLNVFIFDSYDNSICLNGKEIFNVHKLQNILKKLQEPTFTILKVKESENVHHWEGRLAEKLACTFDYFIDEKGAWFNNILTIDVYQANGLGVRMTCAALKVYGKIYTSTATEREIKENRIKNDCRYTTDNGKNLMRLVKKCNKEKILREEWILNPKRITK